MSGKIGSRSRLIALRHAWARHLLLRGGAFDGPWYRCFYPDSNGWDPAVHYLTIGTKLGYQPHVLFDAQYWLEQRGRQRHSDPFLDYLTAPERWSIAPSPYLKIVPPTSQERRDSAASPLGIYRRTGGTRGLAVTALFDEAFYRLHNPDIVEAGLDPFLHYIDSGGREGRSPCAIFDANFYRERNPDVRAGGWEPLRHFLMRGAHQGRDPHRAISMTFLMREGGPGADPVKALVAFDASCREGLASGHRQPQPPEAPAAAFDALPWRYRRPACARGRLLVVTIGPADAARMDALAALDTDPGAPVPWLVFLDAPDPAAVDHPRLPSLDLAALPAPGEARARALDALVRRAAFAGPLMRVALDETAEETLEARAVRAAAAELGLGLGPERLRDLAGSRPPVRTPSGIAASAIPAQISVVVPSYQHADFIEERLVSIAAQTRAVDELILVDDASRDDTVARVRALAPRLPPLTIIERAENSGSPFVSWAEGVARARSEIVWIAESDDVADPRLVERLAPLLEADPRVVLAYCQSRVIDAAGRSIAPDHLFYTDEIDPRRWEAPYIVEGADEIARALSIKNTIPNASAVLFRRVPLAEIVGDLARFRYCGDWAAYLALAHRGRIAYCPEPLNAARRHERSVTVAAERTEAFAREVAEVRGWARSTLDDPASDRIA